MAMAGTICIDGTFRGESDATVSVLDHGLLYGDGVFEGIRAYNHRVFKLERHVDRLFDSAKAIRLTIPATRAEVCALVVQTCLLNEIVDGYIRVVVTRGAGDLGIDPRSCGRPQLIIIARPPLTLYRAASHGLTVVTSSFRRPPPDTTSPGIKSLNYLNNVLARIEANDRGADEALLLDSHGFVAEASADNVFIRTDRGLLTPPCTTNLRGITRETVLELAASLGLPCAEQTFTLFDVWTAHEMFVCGTAAEIAPVLTVDGRTIGSGQLGTWTARLRAAYAELVRASGTPIRREAAVSLRRAATA
jgi:branched-chain amino acid aminotransferase